MSFLEKIGIIGWEKVEASVLASIVINHPIMLEGAHGEAKTTASKLLMWSLFGDDFTFQDYIARGLSLDRLTGPLNPMQMSKGTMGFLKSETTVWDKKAVLLDEFLMADPFGQSELVEFVRTKKVMGKDTGAEFVLSATNPPGGLYDSMTGTVPMIDRFIVIKVPDLDRDDLDQVLDGDSDLGSKYPGPHVYNLVKKVRTKVKSISDADRQVIKRFVIDVVFVARDEFQLRMSTRKAKVLRDFMTAIVSLARATGEVDTSPSVIATAIAGMIPECTGLCKVKSPPNRVEEFRARVIQLMATLNDAIQMSSIDLEETTLTELVDKKVGDRMMWLDLVVKKVYLEEDQSQIYTALKSITAKSRLDPSNEFDTLTRHLKRRIAQIITLKPTHRFTLEEIQNTINVIVGS